MLSKQLPKTKINQIKKITIASDLLHTSLKKFSSVTRYERIHWHKEQISYEVMKLT